MSTPSVGVWIESLTWPEVESALAEYDTVLIPLGARCKEHGPHLPINTDWLEAEYLAKRIVAACRVIAIPTVSLGYYPAFAEYPGSISLGETTFRDVILDIARSFTRHGIRKFYVLNTGISTIPPLEEAKRQMSAEGSRLEFLNLTRVARSERRRIEKQPYGSHADELETSMMLYIESGVVHMDRAVPELSPPRAGPLTRIPDAKTGVYSATGSWGDPTLASMETGRIITEAIVAETIELLRRTFDL